MRRLYFLLCIAVLIVSFAFAGEDCKAIDAESAIKDVSSSYDEVKFTRKADSIYVHGFVLPISEMVKENLEPEYLDVYAAVSPDKRSELLMIGTGRGASSDFWYLDLKIKKSVKLEPMIGSHMSAMWLSNELFAIWNGGMGYNSTDIYNRKNIGKRTVIEDMAYFNPEYSLYVAGVKDMEGKKCSLKIGTLKNAKTEIVELPADFYNVEWVAYGYLNVEIIKDELHICIENPDRYKVFSFIHKTKLITK